MSDVATADVVERLRRSAPEAVTVERTTAERLAGAVERVVEPPAVGTGVGIDGVSLPESVASLPTAATPAAARERGDLLRAAKTGVTPARRGIAERGTVTVRSRGAGDELASLYVDRHVAVLPASNVVSDVRTALAGVADGVAAARASEGDGAAADDDRSASEVLTTGPSATADMGALVEGVHGPREVVVLAVEDR